MAASALPGATGRRPARRRPWHAMRDIFTPARLDSPLFLLTFWFVARLIVLGIWALLGLGVQGDVLYYYDNIGALGSAGPAQTMPEYPTPSLWLLALPWLLSFGTATGYSAAFACLMLLLDAAFTYSLWRTGGHRRGQAVVFWSLFLAFIGPTAYLRFDLIVSVLTGWALILVARKRRFLGGVLIGWGAAIKLWPALLWPALCGGSAKTARRVTAGVLVTGVAVASLSLAWAGWDRLLSPLDYQTDRGLQVESVFASLPMLGRSLGIGDYAVTVSRYLAFEIWGTGVPFWLNVASVAVIAGYALIALVYVAWFLRGHGRLIEGCVLTLLAIVTLIVTNKTFSPQYVIWLGAPLAATFVVMAAERPRREDRRHLKRITWLVLAVALATLIIYPIGYAALVSEPVDGAPLLRLPVTLILVARNVMMVWLFGELLAWTIRFLKPAAWLRQHRHPAGALPDGEIQPVDEKQLTDENQPAGEIQSTGENLVIDETKTGDENSPAGEDLPGDGAAR